MQVIVTGSEGFVGKALVAVLERRGVQVISIDRKNGTEVSEYFTNNSLLGIDCVYHLAAQTSVFNDNKNDILHDNVEAFKIVCDACKRHDVKLVYASSSTANPCNTTSLYGISKHFDEEYARLYNPKATGVRLHNVYGSNPRQGTLLWHLTHDNPVKLMNRGHNERHFTYLDDVVEGLIYAYGCSKPLINVANPEKTTIYDFAVAVQAYKPFDIVLVNKKREFDRIAQEVDESIFTVPLPYTSVENGLKAIFNG